MAAPEPKRGKKGASDNYMIVDARERSVIPFVEAEFQEHAYVVKQVNTGDYLICSKKRDLAEAVIRACIERKGLEDFASSFGDGRYESERTKMLELRAKTGCQLYWIIEGPAFPKPNRRFSRIPYSHILAAMTKLMLRDGMFVIQTENEAHTAKRLVDLLRAFDTETPYGEAPCQSLAGSGHPPSAGSEGKIASAAENDPLAVPEVLTGRIEQTDDEAATGMWDRLKGISVVLGKILTRKFSVAELAMQKVSIDQIQSLKTVMGRKINKDAVASLLAVRAGSRPHAVKLVSGLRGVSPAVATSVLNAAGGLASLCSWSVVTIAMVAMPQKNRTIKLGKTRAERIRRLLHHRDDSGGAPIEDLNDASSEKPRQPQGPAAGTTVVEDLLSLVYEGPSADGSDADGPDADDRDGQEADDISALPDAEVDAILGGLL